MIKSINHIAIVLPDLEAGKRFWVEAMGLQLDHVAHVPTEGVDVAFLPVGDAQVELVQPLDEASGVARYLEKRGPGIHHICFEVDDIHAQLARLRAAGIELINETPRITAEGKQYAFVHPRSTGGVLVELYELAAS
jgi:methylmalonyl-CoA/ethylmalonyl-CoA epimerase